MFWLILLFIIASVIGYKLISSVPSLLFTPLMSGMNALSGITVLGAILATAGAIEWHSRILGALSIILASINVVAGFMVTQRMLLMFKETKSRELQK